MNIWQDSNNQSEISFEQKLNEALNKVIEEVIDKEFDSFLKDMIVKGKHQTNERDTQGNNKPSS
jgi:hypothetical protein